ncbi:hypothetical protein AGDE_16922 [Angomonas deanei]|nr:hypothetical protein AGDE_16922 [Angomonas deanei]|eukprot:EPY15887.1 hypothetical protein AGDE_16922 [Angomonas deanei]
MKQCKPSRFLWGQKNFITQNFIPSKNNRFSGFLFSHGIRRYAKRDYQHQNKNNDNRFQSDQVTTLWPSTASPFIVNDINEATPLLSFTPMDRQEMTLFFHSISDHSKNKTNEEMHSASLGGKRYLERCKTALHFLHTLLFSQDSHSKTSSGNRPASRITAAESLQSGVSFSYLYTTVLCTDTQQYVTEGIRILESIETLMNKNDVDAVQTMWERVGLTPASILYRDVQRLWEKTAPHPNDPHLFVLCTDKRISVAAGLAGIIASMIVGNLLHYTQYCLDASSWDEDAVQIVWRPHPENVLGVLTLMEYLHTEKEMNFPFHIVLTAHLLEDTIIPLLNSTYPSLRTNIVMYDCPSQVCHTVKEQTASHPTVQTISIQAWRPQIVLFDDSTTDVSLNRALDSCFFPLGPDRHQHSAIVMLVVATADVPSLLQRLKTYLQEVYLPLLQHSLSPSPHPCERGMTVALSATEYSAVRELVSAATRQRLPAARWQLLFGGFPLSTTASKGHYYIPAVLLGGAAEGEEDVCAAVRARAVALRGLLQDQRGDGHSFLGKALFVHCVPSFGEGTLTARQVQAQLAADATLTDYFEFAE